MATRNELDAYFSGDPSYELYKKLYGGSGSNAGQINKMYDAQLDQANAYYDAQLQKLAGQNAQQQQQLAAENMRAGRGIRYATTQGGLNNSGVQAQAGVLNAIAGQKAQGTLAAQYQQNVADLEADRAQQAYGLEANRQNALYEDQQNALERQAKYASIMSSYGQQMASEQAAAAKAAQQAALEAQTVLNADALVYRDAADLDAYYRSIADMNSQAAQNIINTYGLEAYKTYVSNVEKKLSNEQKNSTAALTTSITDMSSDDAATYYDKIADPNSTAAQELINSVGRANYDKIVKEARAKAAEYRRQDEIDYLYKYFQGANESIGQQILDYYNYDFIPKKYSGRSGIETDVAKALTALIKAQDDYFGWITAADLDTIINSLAPIGVIQGARTAAVNAARKRNSTGNGATTILEDFDFDKWWK